jgi:peptidoglycan/LPS O-acetylase OafA/YrhL
MKTHFKELDGIRGLLSVVILLFHLGLNPLIGRLTLGWIAEGRYELAVDFFFILSGFVLCHVSLGRRPDIQRFLIGRAFRMLPVSIVSLGLCLLATRSVGNPTTLAANLLLAQLFLGLPHLNRVAWSACSEMWMPGFLVYGAWLGRKQGRVLLWGLLIFMWALGGFSMADNGNENRHLVEVLRSVVGLSAGFLVCLLFPAPADEAPRPASAYPWASPVHSGPNHGFWPEVQPALLCLPGRRVLCDRRMSSHEDVSVWSNLPIPRGQKLRHLYDTLARAALFQRTFRPRCAEG